MFDHEDPTIIKRTVYTFQMEDGRYAYTFTAPVPDSTFVGHGSFTTQREALLAGSLHLNVDTEMVLRNLQQVMAQWKDEERGNDRGTTA